MGDKETAKPTVDLEGLPKEQAQRIATAMKDQDFSKLQPTDFIALEKLVMKGKEEIKKKEDEKREKITGGVKEQVKKCADFIRNNFIGITDVRFGVSYSKEHPDGEIFVAAKRDRELVLSIGAKPRAGSNGGVIQKGKYAGMTRAERREARKAAKEAAQASE